MTCKVKCEHISPIASFYEQVYWIKITPLSLNYSSVFFNRNMPFLCQQHGSWLVLIHHQAIWLLVGKLNLLSLHQFIILLILVYF